MAPSERALSLAVLRAHEEVRSPDELAIPEEKAKPQELKMAKLLIDQLSGEWDPTEHPNEYKQALGKLLSQKRTFALAEAGKAAPDEENVVDLMEALKRSIGQVKKAPKKAASKPAARTHHRTTAKKAGAA